MFGMAQINHKEKTEKFTGIEAMEGIKDKKNSSLKDAKKQNLLFVLFREFRGLKIS